MEQKRKIDVDIAGISMTLITDESDSFVQNVVKRMNESMKELLSHNMKRSRLDAALLCAIGFCGDKLTADKRVRNLEAQISLYDVNLRKLRNEVASLKKELAEVRGQGDENLESNDSGDKNSQTNLTESTKSSQISIDDKTENTKEDKLKLIETLLRKKDGDEKKNNQ